MFRRARWVILLAIVFILGSVTTIYLAQKKLLRRNRPHTAAPLPANTAATAPQWEYEIKSGERVKVRLRATHFEQIKEPAAFLLENLEMEIHDAKGTHFDLVKTARANFDVQAATMYSDGDVEITMNLPEQGVPAGRLLKIRSTGVTFDSMHNRVWTERQAFFDFEGGNGESVGASYDSVTKELIMKSAVKLDWKGKSDKPPMHLETEYLTYREGQSEIYLSPYARLQRDTFTLNSADAVVFLKHSEIDRVEAQKASGTDNPPGRQVQYAADFLNMYFGEKGVINKIEASEHASLTSTSASGTTNVTSKRFDLDFENVNGDSVLKKVLANGESRVESRGVAKPGQPPPSPRVLTSEVIQVDMRPGGKEIAQVITHAPGQVEFLPAKPGDKKRTVNGERLYITYGAANAIEKFRAVQATTRTESVDKKGKPVVSTTSSQDLEAYFDPRTGQMTKLEQWQNFKYESAGRNAVADRAIFDAATEIITLRTKARMWDETGSTSADEIVLEQQSGDMVATGNVSSTRLPDKKQTTEGMLSPGEPLQAKADRMATTDRNEQIRYEGNALLWQSASRLAGKSIFIDRKNQRLEAKGDVVSQFPDQRDDADPKQKRKPANMFTVVKAPAMTYSDVDRIAYYRGGVTLDRPQLSVKSKELRAWFVKEPKAGGGEETKLDRMFADGAVDILDQSPKRVLKANSEHAEYYLEDERVVINGGAPVVDDSKKGITRGNQITWLSREDNLYVDNSGTGPAVSRIKNKKK